MDTSAVPFCGLRVIDEVINAADIARVVSILHSKCCASHVSVAAESRCEDDNWTYCGWGRGPKMPPPAMKSSISG
jgi:hypothetical protein